MFKGTGDTTQLGGPIKIAKITGQVAKLGFIAFLSIMAYISISLGFINLLPIPMLDGGHLMFYAFEKVLGRPLTQRTQEGFFRIGLFLLLSLMFFTTFNDLTDLGLFLAIFLIKKVNKINIFDHTIYCVDIYVKHQKIVDFIGFL